MSTIAREFREFIDKGNFIDLAVGFVMGVAVKDVINVIVERTISPLLAYVLPGNTLQAWGVFGPVGEDGTQVGSLGAVLLALINFVATAAVLFVIVRAYNRFQRRREDEAEEEPEADPEEVVLLREIRDSLAR